MILFRADYTKYPDAQLVKQIAKKDERAFEELYSRYNARLYRYFIRLCRDKTHAQDLLQDLFLRLITKAHLFDKKYKFSTWLYTIAYRLYINQVRKKSVQKESAQDMQNSEFHFSDVQDSQMDKMIDHAWFKERLNFYLENLDEEKRHTFILRFQERLNISEIAEIMKCPSGTVKSRLHYMIKAIGQQFVAFKDI